MKMLFPIALSACFYPRQRGLAAAGISASMADWSQGIVEGRRREDGSRVRQDKSNGTMGGNREG